MQEAPIPPVGAGIDCILAVVDKSALASTGGLKL